MDMSRHTTLDHTTIWQRLLSNNLFASVHAEKRRGKYFARPVINGKKTLADLIPIPPTPEEVFFPEMYDISALEDYLHHHSGLLANSNVIS